MNALFLATAYRNLREQPLWKLLAADKAPVFLALLQVLLFDGEKTLPSSVLHERLNRVLQHLRANGEELPQTAQGYLSLWLTEGWLTRRFPAGALEEEYELSANTVSAIRFASSLLQPRTTATESRLYTVMQQLTRLAEETDTNPATRLAALEAERERINLEIAAVKRGGARTLSSERAIERAREIIALADELAADFRRVRDEFDRLNRKLRESLMESGGSRGDVLESLFAGVDLIGESEAGKTFYAFWRLLTDPEQSATLEAAVKDVVSRPFAATLSVRERRFLIQLTKRLMDEGRGVHDVLQSFAKSLKTFVQSREYLEHRRLHELLKGAWRAALEAKEHVRLNKTINYTLTLTSSKIRSASQWSIRDLSQHTCNGEMLDAEPPEMTLDHVSELIHQSEIDFRTLKEHIRVVLLEQTQASIGQLLDRFPAEQGLGSVVGYIALGAKHGELAPNTEEVSWTGNDGERRRARIPSIHFMRERIHELVD